MEYDYATDIEVQREEAFEKGLSQGISIEQIAQGTGLSIEEINNLAK